MDREARALMVRARAELVLGHPFFAALALRLPLAEDAECRTAWCDGERLAYNPSRVRTMGLDRLVGVLGHEMLHLACGHHLRRGGREPGLWNAACDYAINWICLEAGLTLPEGYLDDPDLRDLPVERIYAALLSKKGEEEHGGAESSSEGEGVDETEDGSAGGAEDSGQDQDGAAGLNRPQGDEEDADDGDAGGSPDGEGAAKPGEGGADPAGTGEVRDAPSGAGGGDRRGREDLMQLLARAEMAVRDMGDLPAGLARVLDLGLRPSLPWRDILARFVEANAKNDFTWLPPSRRHLHMGLHLPGLHTMELPELVVAVDTSGSVGPDELSAFGAELSAILEDFDTTVHLVTCDAGVSGHEVLGRADLPLSLAPRGGGGTDFRPVFEYVDEQGLAPACLVFFSDMECNRFPDEPGYPVLWVGCGGRDATPPFGEFVSMV